MPIKPHGATPENRKPWCVFSRKEPGQPWRGYLRKRDENLDYGWLLNTPTLMETRAKACTNAANMFIKQLKVKFKIHLRRWFINQSLGVRTLSTG